MHVAFTLRVVNSGKSDLPKNDSTVRRRRTADLHQVVADSKRDEVLIGHALGTRPHGRLVLIPIMAGFEDLRLDGVLDNLEGLEGLLGGRMRCVQVDLLSIGCADITPSVV